MNEYRKNHEGTGAQKGFLCPGAPVAGKMKKEKIEKGAACQD
jgi:hypothetical protein